MIATILPSSSNFHAVEYNENKVAKGQATLLEIKNFGKLDIQGYNSPEELIEFLTEYSSMNSRIKKAQFHMAFSCKGNEMSYEQLVDFAHQYLEELGYAKPGQPLLIYAHSDTDNNHIHVITSRVDPGGRKINDSKERIRSQKALDKLLNTDVRKKTSEDVKQAKQFHFESINQFRAIVEAMNYECYEKDRMVHVKRNGYVQCSIPVVMAKEIRTGT